LDILPVSAADLALIGFLAFLEGILSIDNALVLAMMARHLPPKEQRKALTYGLVGAVVFRLAALGLVTRLIHWTWVKYAGGGYLIFIALKHLLARAEEEEKDAKRTAGMGFWRTVVMIELMDIAFAVDSILAAVALTSKFWIIFLGGFIGVVMMRFAATVFLKLLGRFPGFEQTAYWLVLLIGIKVILEAMHLPGLDFHSSSSPATWVFWSLMTLFLALGFRRPRRPGPHLKSQADAAATPGARNGK
jgi:YkoY family integral membrane protein